LSVRAICFCDVPGTSTPEVSRANRCLSRPTAQRIRRNGQRPSGVIEIVAPVLGFATTVSEEAGIKLD
jgi:hypothetical protein